MGELGFLAALAGLALLAVVGASIGEHRERRRLDERRLMRELRRHPAEQTIGEKVREAHRRQRELWVVEEHDIDDVRIVREGDEPRWRQ